MSSEPKRIEVLGRALIIERGSVLLCRNVDKGYRYLPGGHVEPGEGAMDAVLRELEEEASMPATAGPLLAVLEVRFTQKGKPKHELNLVFHVEREGGGDASPILSLEPDIAFDWIPLSDLARADIRPDSVREWLERRIAPNAQAAHPDSIVADGIAWASESP